MSTTQRTGAPEGAVVTLSLREPIAVRAALIRELVHHTRSVADLAGQYTLDPLTALGDDTTRTDLELSLEIATNLLANVVAIEALGVFEAEDDDIEPPPIAPTPSARARCAIRPASALAIAAPASLAGLALLTHAARRRQPRH
ncbi:MAG TPA: hypothetical protein VGM33_21960 [Baekduia sp.]|jgi:hypothetical protein